MKRIFTAHAQIGLDERRSITLTLKTKYGVFLYVKDTNELTLDSVMIGNHPKFVNSDRFEGWCFKYCAETEGLKVRY